MVKRFKDMWLHLSDLLEAKQSLDFVAPDNLDAMNRAFAQNSIVLFYKCFGSSKFRNNSLRRDTILAGYPPEAKEVFDYYKNLRDKFIAHDESRFAQAYVWSVLESTREFPLVNIVGGVAIAENFKGEGELRGLKSFYRLVMISIQWVDAQIDELTELLRKQYGEKKINDFCEFEPAEIKFPTKKDMFEKRY